MRPISCLTYFTIVNAIKVLALECWQRVEIERRKEVEEETGVSDPVITLAGERNLRIAGLPYGGPTPRYWASAEKTLTEIMVFDENVLTERPDDISVFLLHMARNAHYLRWPYFTSFFEVIFEELFEATSVAAKER
ncbi:hypothetical protein HW537_07360 [Asaia siamensis]